MKRAALLAALWSVALVVTGLAQPKPDRATKVRDDRKHVESDDRWIYNDLPRGLAEAKDKGKPLLVVFRCIPCEACSRFDDLVVKRDERIQTLMDGFVCVRIVQANRLDLELFQFDYDQSFHAFLMNADKTIYGRFGTRSEHEDEFQDMTMEGFAEALEGALELHKDFSRNKPRLAGKRGPKPAVKSPEEYPSLSKYPAKLDYEGKVVASCMHCHQIRDAERTALRSAGKPLPDKVLYPYPLPHSIGLEMDPKRKAAVREVTRGSAADASGFEAGDEILELGGQPLLSIADIQWVLHNAGDSANVSAAVLRGGRETKLSLDLPAGWRKACDISWRPTTWELRACGTGGLVLTDLPDDERKGRGIKPRSLALLVKYVGQYDRHAAGKNAGFQQGDVIVRVDGKDERMTESAFLDYTLNSKRPGQQAKVAVLRDGKELSLQLPMQ